MSVPQSNSTHTNENPYDEFDLTLRTFVAPFTAVSIGNVTIRSTSSAAIPCASVITTTVGAVKSGNTSTSISLAVYVPRIISTTAPSKTKNLLFNENSIILFNITSGFNVHVQHVDQDCLIQQQV